MRRTLRFLWRFTWPNWLILWCMAALIVLGSVTPGLPEQAARMFANYLGIFPVMIPMLLMMLCMGLCSATFQLAASFGARRRDYFLGVQIILVLDVLMGYGMLFLLKNIPVSLMWVRTNELGPMLKGALEWMGWRYPLMIFSHVVLGCVVGLVLSRSKALGGILTVLSAVYCVAGFLGLTLAALFGNPEWVRTVLTVLPALIAIGGEIYLWRNVRRSTVV